jgi:fatty acid desaturase
MAAGHFAVSRRPWVNELVGDWAGLDNLDTYVDVKVDFGC